MPFFNQARNHPVAVPGTIQVHAIDIDILHTRLVPNCKAKALATLTRAAQLSFYQALIGAALIATAVGIVKVAHPHKGIDRDRELGMVCRNPKGGGNRLGGNGGIAKLGK